MEDDKTSKLNDLLEDALDDLLINDDEDVRNDGPSVIDKIAEQSTSSSESSKTETNKKGSNKGASNVDNKPKFNQNDFSVDEEGIDKFFEHLTAKLSAEAPKIDPEEAGAKIDESLPQILDLMQNLLSKKLLYPALKDLSPKFDEWLKTKGPSLSKSERKRYTSQKAIIDEIIENFDDESLTNLQRFEKNVDLMETMQSLGPPPEELTVPQEMSKCSIM